MIFPKQEELEILKHRSQLINNFVDSFEQNKYESLKQDINNALQELKDDDDPYYLGFLDSILIRIFISENNVKQVVKYVNEILIFSGMVLYEYCGKYSPFEKEILERVISCYDELIKQNDVSAMWGKARILHFQNRWDAAHALYEKALELASDDSMLLRMYGRLFEDECKYSKALDLYEKVKGLGLDPLIDCFIANVYVKLGNFDCAIDILKETIEKNPSNTVALFRINNIYIITGNMEEAENVRDKLLKSCPYNTKYLLYTTDVKNDDSLKLYELIQDTVKDGYDYTVVNRFIGDYYFFRKKYEQSLSYYQDLLSNNQLHPATYSNMFVSLMYLTKYLDKTNNKTKEYEELRQQIIIQARINIIYDRSALLNFESADKLPEKRIEVFEKEKKKSPNCIDNYLILYDLYLKENDKKRIVQDMKENFSESWFPYIKEIDLLSERKQYREVEKCLNTIENIFNLKCKKKYKNKEIDKLRILNSFYMYPDKFYEQESLIEEDTEIYKDLIEFYFNLCHKSEKYVNIAYECIENSDLQQNDENKELLFIKSLILVVRGEKEKAQEIYNSLFATTSDNTKLSILDMIQICGDIFDISYLYELFIKCPNYEEYGMDQSIFKKDVLKKLYFYEQVLLYLLHSNYIKLNPLVQSISHYTSIKTLSFLLDDKNPSPLRLSTLNSANDLKEGKILLDILSKDIKDIKIIQKIHEKISPKFCALQTSFTLMKDALTMFRLYGKSENNEGTGVNLIFKDIFFNDKIKMPINKFKTIFEQNKDKDISSDEPSKPSIEEKDDFEKKSLYFVLYYDKSKNVLIFNPFDIYKSSIIDLNKKRIKWTVINQENKSLLEDKRKQERYLKNIAFVFLKLKRVFAKVPIYDVETAKTVLLNINYLVKDASFVDEKELRMITIDGLNSDNLEHDTNAFGLYKNYMTVQGNFRYDKRNYLDKIILGPKVSQKDAVAEYFVNHLIKLGLDDVSVTYSNAPLA